MNEVYSDTLNNIRDNIKGYKIWVWIDETKDVIGRYVTNVVIGTFETDHTGKVYSLNTEVLDKANYSTIIKLFHKSNINIPFLAGRHSSWWHFPVY